MHSKLFFNEMYTKVHFYLHNYLHRITVVSHMYINLIITLTITLRIFLLFGDKRALSIGDTYMDRSSTLFLASSLFLTLLFLLATRFGDNLRVAHIKLVLLESTRSFSHRTATESCDQLCQWVGLAFILVLVHFLQLGILERLLSAKQMHILINLFSKLSKTN